MHTSQQETISGIACQPCLHSNCFFFKNLFVSFDSIREFAKTFKTKYNHLDVLVNNAGVAYCDYGMCTPPLNQQCVAVGLIYYDKTS